LQQSSYNSSQIFDAMSQADIKGAVSEEAPAPPGGPMPQAEPIQYEEPQPMPSYEMPPQMPSAGTTDRALIEEVAESIIDEKWEELMKNMDKIVAWKDETTGRIAKIEQEIKDVKERFEALHAGVLSKVSEYDKGIKDVGTDIRAMEDVFKKVIPAFTENVGELSRITKKLKSSK
jgi:hypothetical protein